MTPKEKARQEKFMAGVREAMKESRVRIGESIREAVREGLEATQSKADSVD